MAHIKLCVPCGEQGREVPAAQILDGEGFCRACLRTAGGQVVPEQPAVRLVPPPKVAINPMLCVKGCGMERHRGRCFGPYISRTYTPQKMAGLCTRGCGRESHRGCCKGVNGRIAAVRARQLEMEAR